jgi:hypothetical protein
MATTIKGKTIDEINIMLQEAMEEDQAEREAYFDAQWEKLKQEIADQYAREEAIAAHYEDMEWGRLVMENDLGYADLSKGW